MTLGRRKALERKTELTRTGPPERSGRLRSRSPATAAKSPERAAVVAAALARDRGCVLRGWSRCGGRLDGHEVLRRGKLHGAAYRLDMVVMICRDHHELDGTDMRLAERLGIRITRAAWDRLGPMVFVEASTARAIARTGRLPPPPSWW